MEKTIEKVAFNERMQVLGFENNEINLIWNVMNPKQEVAKEDFQTAMEFLEMKCRA